MLDPDPQKTQPSLINKLRASMNPGVQSILQQSVAGSSPSAPTSVAKPPVPSISQADQLNILDEVLTEMENSAAGPPAQATPPPAVEPLAPLPTPVPALEVAPPVETPAPLSAQPADQAPTQEVAPQLSAYAPLPQETPAFSPVVTPEIQPVADATLSMESPLEPSAVPIDPMVPAPEIPGVVAELPTLAPQPSVLDQALPAAVTQMAAQQNVNTLNPPRPAGSPGKEKVESSTPDMAAIEAAQAIQYVEQEPNPEIPPEVDGFLKRAEDHASQAPQEIVIADGSTDTPVENTRPSQPVVVLPLTLEIEKKGEHKSSKFSIRWLVEWSRKIMKKFVGKVIYREE